MPNINIKAKIRAYQKGILPTKTSDLINDGDGSEQNKYIMDAPNDGDVYGRQDNKWRSITDDLTRMPLELDENSGLTLRRDGINYIIGLDKWEGTQAKFDELEELNDNTTYYTYREEE